MTIKLVEQDPSCYLVSLNIGWDCLSKAGDKVGNDKKLLISAN